MGVQPDIRFHLIFDHITAHRRKQNWMAVLSFRFASTGAGRLRPVDLDGLNTIWRQVRVSIPSRKPIRWDSDSVEQFNSAWTDSIHAEETSDQ
jgi:hypothetical protein